MINISWKYEYGFGNHWGKWPRYKHINWITCYYVVLHVCKYSNPTREYLTWTLVEMFVKRYQGKVNLAAFRLRVLVYTLWTEFSARSGESTVQTAFWWGVFPPGLVEQARQPRIQYTAEHWTRSGSRHVTVKKLLSRQSVWINFQKYISYVHFLEIKNLLNKNRVRNLNCSFLFKFRWCVLVLNCECFYVQC